MFNKNFNGYSIIIYWKTWTFPTISCIPKKRLNREINRNVKTLKGKWIVDFNWGIKFNNLNETFSYIEDFLINKLTYKLNQLACYGKYNSEEIPILDGAYTRTQNYWQKDVSEK